MHKNVKDIAGQQFGKLTVIERDSSAYQGVATWFCHCDCGGKLSVSGASLRKGNTKSCGCLSLEKTTKRFTKHGKAKSPEHNAWRHMRSRCYNPNGRNYKNWGGRGITVCERWLESFENFYADMGDRPTPKHSLDRINVNGNYEPSNCRWATTKEQRINQRPHEKRGKNDNISSDARQQ